MKNGGEEVFTYQEYAVERISVGNLFFYFAMVKRSFTGIDNDSLNNDSLADIRKPAPNGFNESVNSFPFLSSRSVNQSVNHSVIIVV